MEAIDVTIASWSDLATRLDLYRDRQCLFRGESDDRHQTLLPKVGRVSKTPGSARKLPYSFDDEERVFKHFKRAARPYLSHEPKSELEWLAIAQHHGLPTRLLDWTESLLVAAFFAVKITRHAWRDLLSERCRRDFAERRTRSATSARRLHVSPAAHKSADSRPAECVHNSSHTRQTIHSPIA